MIPGCARRDDSSVHEEIEAVRPHIAPALVDIEKRAPRAVTVVVGYGDYILPGGCPLKQPLTPEGADYVDGLTQHMSRVLREEALAKGATFAALDTLPGAGDHTACAEPGQRWLEGLLPSALDGAVPFHPTALGMAALADGVAAAAERARAAQLEQVATRTRVRLTCAGERRVRVRISRADSYAADAVLRTGTRTVRLEGRPLTTVLRQTPKRPLGRRVHVTIRCERPGAALVKRFRAPTPRCG